MLMEAAIESCSGKMYTSNLVNSIEKYFVMAVFEVEILAIQSCSRNRFLKHKTTTHHTFLKVSVVFLKKSNHEF